MIKRTLDSKANARRQARGEIVKRLMNQIKGKGNAQPSGSTPTRPHGEGGRNGRVAVQYIREKIPLTSAWGWGFVGGTTSCDCKKCSMHEAAGSALRLRGEAKVRAKFKAGRNAINHGRG